MLKKSSDEELLHQTGQYLHGASLGQGDSILFK